MDRQQNKDPSTAVKPVTDSVEYQKIGEPIPVKPVTVRIEDFRTNLNKVVAESELPPFLSVMVLREMLLGINSVAEKEYAQDREAWEKACKEGEKDG